MYTEDQSFVQSKRPNKFDFPKYAPIKESDIQGSNKKSNKSGQKRRPAKNLDNSDISDVSVPVDISSDELQGELAQPVRPMTFGGQNNLAQPPNFNYFQQSRGVGNPFNPMSVGVQQQQAPLNP